MQIFSFFLFFTTFVSLAEEKTVQVGKHVTSSTNATTMILSLLIVLMVVAVSAYILKKFQITTQNSNQCLKVISSIHIGAKERVIIVQIAQKQLILGVTANQITLLDTLNEPLESVKSTTESFDKSVISMLKKSIKKND